MTVASSRGRRYAKVQPDERDHSTGARVEAWAREHSVTRLELTTMTHNRRAIALYERHGFRREGTREGSIAVGGQRYDELYMAKLL